MICLYPPGSRYFATLQFQSIPGRRGHFPYRGPVAKTFNPGCQIEPPSNIPIPDQYELYNLTRDPLEVDNLVHRPTPERKQIRKILAGLLREQCKKTVVSKTHLSPVVFQQGLNLFYLLIMIKPVIHRITPSTLLGPNASLYKRMPMGMSAIAKRILATNDPTLIFHPARKAMI